MSGGRVLGVIKWVGTVLCLFLLTLFIYSTRRAVMWTSPGLRYQTVVVLGTIGFAWRPESWRRAADPYAGWPGWTVASFEGATWVWWVTPGATRAWAWITVPLWMPMVGVATPTALLWYRDRRAIPRTLHRLADWLRPRRRKRLTV